LMGKRQGSCDQWTNLLRPVNDFAATGKRGATADGFLVASHDGCITHAANDDMSSCDRRQELLPA
jgi:hypothetical protein